MNELDRIAVIVDDITSLQVDAIVNPASKTLDGGGGVDGAIHKAAGPELLEACRLLGRCEPGDAVATPGFRLDCRHVIHTVGPIWSGGSHGEQAMLRSCYQRCLALADELDCNSIALPCISTGIHGYPKSDACAVAIETVRRHLAGNCRDLRVILCCHTPRDGERYREHLRTSPDKLPHELPHKFPDGS